MKNTKTVATKKTAVAVVTKIVRVKCAKCGRKNIRPVGTETGNCRVASACKSRRAAARRAA